jgi:fumarate reductase flavoprotein subunit
MVRKQINLKKQLVIIGGGGAGLAAAVEAAEKGATDILVLEKRGTTGGISAMAIGPFGIESPADKRQWIVTTKDEAYNKAMEWAHLKVNGRILRAFIDRSGDTIQWLEDKGLFFTVQQHSPLDNPHTMHVAKGMGAEVLKVLANECKRLGIEVRTRTPAKKILIDKQGAVSGVTAASGNSEFTINTKAVIVCTGGYAGNKELMDKYSLNTENMYLGGIPHTGDGFLMATGIGAATDGLGIMLVAGPGPRNVTPIEIGKGNDAFEIPLMFVAREQYVIWVNKFGRRFINESVQLHTFESSNAVRRQPNNLVYAIIDSKMVGLARLMPGPDGKQPRKFTPADIEEAVHRGVKDDNGKWCKLANSLEEIAEWMGCDPKVFKSTVDEYNEGCDRGHDAIFAKDRQYLIPLRNPPFYAFKCGCRIMNTMGGIKINEKMEVLGQNDLPIEGLYAAGVDAGGWTSDTYCTAESGSAFGFALNSGRIAGENAIEYTRSQR